jgi:hypothetical protein
VCNGGYERWFWVDWIEVRARVYRKVCRKCNVSFTLLPFGVLAHWQYPREFVVEWLWAALHETPCRSREFLVEQGVPFPEPDPDMPWDEHRENKVSPSPGLLARWTRTFALRAARLIPMLTSLCMLLEVEFANVAEGVLELGVNGPRLSALPIAVGLVHVLRQTLQPAGQLDLRDSLSELVTCLARDRLPPSHSVVRASGARLTYDSLIT